MSRLFFNNRLEISADFEVRGVGLGLSFWFGQLTLQGSIELPFVLLQISYIR